MRISDWSSDVCSSDLSAVSKQLAEFERSVGVSLFQRLPRGMRLTEAGRMLQGFANRLFAIEAEAEHALRDLRQLARGRIAIGASRTIGAYILPRVLAAFRAEHPGVELARSEEHTSELQSLMRISYAAFCLKKKT